MPTKSIQFKYPQFQAAGRIRAQPLQQIVDGSDIYVPSRDVSTATFAATTGLATVNLPVPTGLEVGYRFFIESGTTAPYTLVDTFDRGISSSSPTDGAQLMDSFFAKDLADRSIAAIARLLSTDPTFLASVPGFTEKAWAAATVFNAGDFCWRGDGLFRASSAHSNKDPLIAANVSPSAGFVWERRLTIPAGAGTTTTDVAFNSTTFNTLPTTPASRKNLVEALATVAAPDLSAYARRDTGNTWSVAQSFASGISVPDRAGGDNTGNAANTRFVTAAVAAIAGLDLVGRVSILEERATQGTANSGSVGVNTRKLTTIQRNGNGAIVGTPSATSFTLKAGTYLTIGLAMANRCRGNKLFLYNNTAGANLSTRSLSSFLGDNLVNSAAQNGMSTFIDVIVLAADTALSLRHDIETGGADALGMAANRTGLSELYAQLILIRLD